MPLEIEIKLKVESHDAVRARLRRLRARHLGTVHETNIFFDRPSGALRRADAGLRVRFTTPLKKSSTSLPQSKIKNPKSKIPQALLTFKGPAAASGLHSRNAYDLHLSPPDQIVPLLEALGFRQLYSFEKIRDSWQLQKCLIELDTLPHFGTFLEIEGPSERAVRTVQKALGLPDLPQHTQSYAHMVAKYLQHMALPKPALTFN